MTTKTNTAEGGTNGTTVTAGNSGGGSGDAVTALPGTTPPIFTTAQQVSGGLSYAFQAATAATSIWQWTGFSGTDFGARLSIRITANPTGTTEIVQLRSASAAAMRILLTTTGKVQVNNAANANVFVSTGSLSVNTWYDIALRAMAGTGTADGHLQMAFYLSTTPTTVIETYSVTTGNAGTATLVDARFGKLSASTWPDTFWIDSITANDTAAGALPAAVVIATTAPNLISTLAPDMAVIDSRNSTAGSAGSLTYTISPSIGVIEPLDGLFIIPRNPDSAVEYTITVTESPSGLTDSLPKVTVPKISTGGVGQIQSLIRTAGTFV